jgi:hypothetical protein
MRWIVGITAALLCVCWLACYVEVAIADTSQPRAEDGWRRTTHGWERNITQTTAATANLVPRWRLHPHPLVATLLLVMLSVMLLVAFTEEAIFAANAENSRVANQASATA